jgi:hypothetical protein
VNLIVTHLASKFSAVYVFRKFITMFTKPVTGHYSASEGAQFILSQLIPFSAYFTYFSKWNEAHEVTLLSANVTVCVSLYVHWSVSPPHLRRSPCCLHFCLIFVRRLIISPFLFPIRSVSYQRKVGDKFFPRLLVFIILPSTPRSPKWSSPLRICHNNIVTWMAEALLGNGPVNTPLDTKTYWLAVSSNVI